MDWVPYWQLWALLVVAAAIPVVIPKRYTLSAGADWFAVHVERFGQIAKTQVVDTYELHDIEVTVKFSYFHFGVYLELYDSTTKASAPLSDIQRDRRTWDLLYNGILHSVAAEAKLNKDAFNRLQLEHVSALYNPRGEENRGNGSIIDSESDAVAPSGREYQELSDANQDGIAVNSNSERSGANDAESNPLHISDSSHGVCHSDDSTERWT